ncbi:MAG: choice-of-anchor D domain-containing protein [Myxococcota bacterium]
MNVVVKRGIMVVVVAVSGAVGCTPDDELGAIQPEIKVDACAPEEFVSDCKLEFGALAIGGSQTRKVTITNPSQGDLTIESVTLGGLEPAYTLEGEIPRTIKALDTTGVSFTVRFSPSVDNPSLSDTLLIKSNASNVPEGQEGILINLLGGGREVGSPHLTINPTECDFGEVGVNVTAYCDISLTNDGTLELQFTDVGFRADNDPVFQPASPFPLGYSLPPGSALTFKMQFRPTAAQQYLGGIYIVTTEQPDPGMRHEINMRGSGGAAPTAVAKVLSINGAPTNEPSPTVRPLDDVILTGVDSAVGSPGRTITGYRWEWVSKPDTSTAELTTPTSMTTGFQFNSNGQDRPGLDVAGTFVVRLTVTDSAGQSSTNDARVSLSAVPAEDLHVQLTWDDADSDMDLHLVRGLGPRFSDSEDCFYQNCKGANGLAWGGGTANPHLDVDDIDGFGPENTNIEEPVDNTYTVGVHYYSNRSGAPEITVTVKVFVQGALLGEYYKTLNRCNQYWEPAKIIWSSTASVQFLDNVTQVAEAPCL